MSVLEWSAAKTDAPTPSGIIAAGVVARHLLEKLRSLTEQDLGRLAVVVNRDLLVLIGPHNILPWVDGLQYCAPHAHARDLWLPTHVTLTLSADLVQAALARRLGAQAVLLLHDPEQIIPLAKAVYLSPALLTWLQQELE